MIASIEIQYRLKDRKLFVELVGDQAIITIQYDDGSPQLTVAINRIEWELISGLPIPPKFPRGT